MSDAVWNYIMSVQGQEDILNFWRTNRVRYSCLDCFMNINNTEQAEQHMMITGHVVI